MTRVLSGAVLLAVAAAIVWLAPPAVFLLAAEVLVVAGVNEFAALSRAQDLAVPATIPAVVAALACAAFSRVFGGLPWLSLDIVLLAGFVAVSVAALVNWSGGAEALALAAASAFPALYLGLPIGAMVAIRETHGAAGLSLLMVTVIVSDTAQYYSGRTFGRRLLAPAISPKKTIAGAVGGFVCAPLALAGAAHWWLPGMTLPARIALGAAVVLFGIGGDLFESMLKRSAGVKDSSGLIPGHGGVLDRIDALLFAAPVFYVVLIYV
jgi:phosphatidate cytidylyltransferase